MNIEVIQGYLNEDNPLARHEAFQYFEFLKESDEGWKLSINLLTNPAKQWRDEVKFFCFQIISHFVKTKYPQTDSVTQQQIRHFIKQWIEIQSSSPNSNIPLIQNKAAQVICMVFLNDYPARWPTFFDDLFSLISTRESATEMYLRILLAINSEIGDREIPRTQKEMDTFTLIKDTMRETCVPKLVDSWYHILVSYPQLDPDLICLCLEVIGSYISWIEISLIANDRFVSLITAFLREPKIRQAACDCIAQIVNKGMDPVAKVKLVESYVGVLQQAGVLYFTGSPDDEDFMVKLATLVNVMGIALLNSWTK